MSNCINQNLKKAKVKFIKEVEVELSVPIHVNDDEIINMAVKHYNLNEDLEVMFLSVEEAEEVHTIIDVKLGEDYIIKPVNFIKPRLHNKKVTALEFQSYSDDFIIGEVHGVRGFEKCSLPVSALKPYINQ